MAQKAFTQEFWQDGIADSQLIGSKYGTIVAAIGVDINSEPGVVKQSRAVTKIDAIGSPTEMCNVAMQTYDGVSFWFSWASGKIWMRTVAGAWSLVHTVANCGGFNGGAVFTAGNQQYLFYSYFNTSTGNDCLGYKPYPGVADWSDAQDTFKVVADGFGATAADYHPMVQQGLFLVIGNGRYLATVDDTLVFTPGGTPDIPAFNYLPAGWTITCGIKYDDDVLFGASHYANTTRNHEYSEALLLRWDLSSASWTQIKPINASGITALLKTDNGTYVFAGHQGIISIYDGTNIELLKRIPPYYTQVDNPINTAYVSPNSVANFNNYALFGLSYYDINYQGFAEGIYSIGRFNAQYPLNLSLPHPVPAYATDLTGYYRFATSVSSYTFSSAADKGVSQSFLALTDTIQYVEVQLKKTNAPTGNAVCKIYAHSGVYGTSSVPTGAALATSNVVDVSTLTTSYATTRFTFAAPLTVTVGTAYVMSIEYTAAAGANTISIAYDAAGAHGGNAAQQDYTTGNWAAAAASDVGFKIYGSFTFDWDLEGLLFGAILVIGDTFLMSFDNSNSTYPDQDFAGVGFYDFNNVVGAAGIILNIAGNQETSKTFTDFALTYRSNYTYAGDNKSALKLEYFNTNYSKTAFTAFPADYEEPAYNKLRIQQKIECNSLQVIINFYSDSTYPYLGPSLTAFHAKWNEQEKL